MPTPLRLTVYRGEAFVAEHKFERDIIKIGRLASAHLKLEDSRVSRIHAVIEAGSDGQDYAIIDMGSTEGTFVNGRKVSKEKLANGDKVEVGEYHLSVAYGVTEASVLPAFGAAEASAVPDGSAPPAPEGFAESGVISANASYEAGHPGAYRIETMGTADVVAAMPDPAGGAPPGSFSPGLSGAWPQGAPASGVYPAHVSGTYPASGAQGTFGVHPSQLPQAYPAPGASGTFAAPPEAVVPGTTGSTSVSGIVPAYGAMPGSGMYPVQPSGFYPAPAGSMAGPLSSEGSGLYPTPPLAEGPPAASEGPYGYGPGAVGSGVNGYHPGWTPPSSVPNNLASAGVPDDERALEIKLIWGNSVLDTVTVTEQPQVSLGDERRVAGFGPLQRIVRCDLEVPSNGLPSKTHVLARRQGDQGTTYVLDIPPGLVGRVERADGMVIPLQLLYEGAHGGERDGAGGVRYLVRPEETIYLGYEHLVIQVRYVRRTELAPVPYFSKVNYVYANTLILALFFHIVAIASFLATPEVSATLTDELFKNKNRFIQTRLTLAEQKKKSSGGLLDKLKGPSAKAKEKEGKSGRKTAKKNRGRVASKGKPDEKEQARRAIDKLLGLGGKGAATGIFGGRGIGGELQAAMGGLKGQRVGDARGLGGLGTRGTHAGGGGLSSTSVGVGDLNTRGRGGGGDGGDGYGQGAASLGGKKERDVEITAGQAVVRGSLSKEIIRRIIRKNQAQIRYCYEKELQRSPGLYGKVATKFIINAQGFVTDASAYQNTMNNAEVARCITAKIRTWRFPKPKGGGIVVVKYPFLFKASG